MSANPSTQYLTLAQLRARRLRPAPGQRAESRYWQGMGYVSTYNVECAVPMRPYKAPTSGQIEALKAGRAMRGTYACAMCRGRCDVQHDRRHVGGIGDVCLACEQKLWLADASQIAAKWVNRSPLLLDVETTGVEDNDQVAEIAILDIAGNSLLDSVVRPTVPCHYEAAKIHGISDDEFAMAPTWPEIAPRVANILGERLVICHNRDFDARMIRQTSRACGIHMGVGYEGWKCTMELLRGHARRISLWSAMHLTGADPEGTRGHRAAGDAERVRRVVLALAARASA